MGGPSGPRVPLAVRFIINNTGLLVSSNRPYLYTRGIVIRVPTADRFVFKMTVWV